MQRDRLARRCGYMRYALETRAPRVLYNPQAVAERLTVWSEDARRAGRLARADALLLAAWEAFDLPSVSDVLAHQAADAANRSAFSRASAPVDWLHEAA